MLVMPDGLSRRVGAKGILIGRHDDCDIVLSGPTVSRRHALVRMTRDGAELLPLGRAPVEVNGKPSDRLTELADGDTITLPGLTIKVEITAKRSDVAPFRLERRRGGSFAISHSPFTLGGGDADDVTIKRWPERALVFHVVGSELYVEVMAGKGTIDGAEIANETVESLAIGAALVYRKEAFVVERPRGGDETTIGEMMALPRGIKIEFLPRGGRVVFDMPDAERSVILSERRFDLVVALLRPPPGHRPGDFIPDEIVSAVVWPRAPEVSRQEINMLISRCRRDLVQAGLAGPRLLERAPGGGGTRLALAPGAPVVFGG